ncbi:porin [Methylorubrum sp. SL192]|uniref:porin n=1 Tax=Methylorubrum sp. SL192 TaxID=2995167 RepID=UPI00227347DA|nr:porin [Methylorubrum sp. SL192]MCY1642781.1 porin [Methylorubrum sp. SL192]
MSRLKSGLLACCASLAAGPAGHAADFPRGDSGLADDLRACNAYGAGFFFIPGTDTCVRFSGRARYEAGFVPNRNRTQSQGDQSQARGMIRLNLDARSQTDFGVLRAFLRIDAASRTGILQSTGTQQRIANASPALGQDTFGRIQNFFIAEKAFVQFAGITAGRAASFFDFYAHDYEMSGLTTGSNLSSTNLLAYTSRIGGGLSLSLSMEDPFFRKQPVYAASVAAAAAPLGAPSQFVAPTAAPTPVILATDGGFNATGAAFLDAVQRSRMPDFVAALHYDDSWGSAHLSSAVANINVGGFIATPALGPAGTTIANDTAAALLAARGVTSGAQTDYGWAVQAGVKLNLPMIASGDGIYLQAAYAEGAMNYTGFTFFTGSYASNLTPIQGASVQQFVSDAVVNPITGKLELSTSFTVVSSFLHYWTPEWRSAFYGSYGALNYKRGTRETFSMLNGLVGNSAPPNAFANPVAFGLSPVLRDTDQVIAGVSLIWSPVRDLDIGIEGTYIGTSVQSGRVPDATYPILVNGLPFVTANRHDAGQIRMRIQCDF